MHTCEPRTKKKKKKNPNLKQKILVQASNSIFRKYGISIGILKVICAHKHKHVWEEHWCADLCLISKAAAVSNENQSVWHNYKVKRTPSEEEGVINLDQHPWHMRAVVSQLVA